jgi:hypothetical protein
MRSHKFKYLSGARNSVCQSLMARWPRVSDGLREQSDRYDIRNRLSAAWAANRREETPLEVQMRVGQRHAQIATLEARLKQLKTKDRLARVRLRKVDSLRARKADTRRKILVGAIVLAKVEQGVVAESQLRQWLDGALRRADDRELFGL